MRARARAHLPPLPHPHHLPPSPLPLALPPHLLSRLAPVLPQPRPNAPTPSNHHRPAPTHPAPPHPLVVASAASRLPSLTPATRAAPARGGGCSPHGDAAALRSLPDLLRGAAVDPVTLPVELLARLSYPLRTSSTQTRPPLDAAATSRPRRPGRRTSRLRAHRPARGAEDWMRPWLGRGGRRDVACD